MGFFSKIMGGVSAVKDEATAEISKYNRKDDVVALLAVTALVAGADGIIEDSERKAAIQYVKTADVFAGFDRTELSNRLENNFVKALNEMVKEDLFDDIRGITDEPETCVKVMKAGIGMAGADGSMASEERDILREVAVALKLNPDSYAKLKV